MQYVDTHTSQVLGPQVTTRCHMLSNAVIHSLTTCQCRPSLDCYPDVHFLTSLWSQCVTPCALFFLPLGDTENEEFVTKFNLSCASQVREAEEISLTAEPDQSSMVIHTRSEDALGHSLLYTSTRYVEIQPHQWSSPSARLMVTVILHGDGEWCMLPCVEFDTASSCYKSSSLLTSQWPSPHHHLTTIPPSSLSPSHPHHFILTHLNLPIIVPIKGIHVIGAYNLVVEPEAARRRADVLEGGSVVLMAAPDQPGHKISLDFEKVVHVKTIKLQGIHQEASHPDFTDQ